MIVKNESLLRAMREGGPCEYCGVWCERRVPHHIFCRGAAGGNRLDHPFNLISLGNDFDCPCHADAQAYRIDRAVLLAIAAERELRALMRAPK